MALPFHHKPGTIRNFLKTPPFFRGLLWCPGRWRRREPWDLAYTCMRRRYSALFSLTTWPKGYAEALGTRVNYNGFVPLRPPQHLRPLDCGEKWIFSCTDVNLNTCGASSWSYSRWTRGIHFCQSRVKSDLINRRVYLDWQNLWWPRTCPETAPNFGKFFLSFGNFKPNFLAFFVFSGTASSCTHRISDTETRRPFCFCLDHVLFTR